MALHRDPSGVFFYPPRTAPTMVVFFFIPSNTLPLSEVARVLNVVE